MKGGGQRWINLDLHMINPVNDTNSPGRLAYSMAETAAVLGISYISVHRLLKRGLLKSSSVLRTKLIAKSEIERFLKESAQ